MPRHTYDIYIWFEFEWVVCTGARLFPGSDFVLGLGLKVSVNAVNKKPRTRN